MKATIQIAFEVESDEELDERDAKNAAGQAAFDHLAFIEVSGYSSDSEWVTVHVDGLGEARVKIDGPVDW